MSSLNPNPTSPEPTPMSALREKLGSATGPAYWRSLDEVADTPSFQAFAHGEFPAPAEWDPVNRRDFIRLLSASMALAGLAGCTRQPPEKIVPYVKAPEQLVPGRPLYFATALVRHGIGTGVLVESHMGRPTKIEGNPEHNSSLGATDARMQAEVLTLYDPDRSQLIKQRGQISTWDLFLADLNAALAGQGARAGAGLRILTGASTSPTLRHLIEQLKTRFPEAGWLPYEPASREAVYQGSELAFGERVETRYEVEKADVLLSLDADFLAAGPAALVHARAFARRRDPDHGQPVRLYAVESTPSLTGTMADHRLRLEPDELVAFATALATRLGVRVTGAGPASSPAAAWVEALVRDLQRHRGRSAVLVGEQQPPFVHALAHAMNDALGNTGATVFHTAPLLPEPTGLAALETLAADMEAGRVDILIIADRNPVYDAPPELRFAERMEKVPLRIHLGLYDDETAPYCHWHIPGAHTLESWGDIRSHDGQVSLIQPLIEPLYGGKSLGDLLALVGGQPNVKMYDVLKAYWERAADRSDFNTYWQQSLHDGVMAGTAFAPRRPKLKSSLRRPGTGEPGREGLTVLIRPDPTLDDGECANNGWLQETPKPLLKTTWDNVICISPFLAGELGIAVDPDNRNREVVELACGDVRVAGPVWILPGQADRTVTVHLGYGRTRAGRFGNGRGFNAYALRDGGHPWSRGGGSITRTGRRELVATTQLHHSLAGRPLIRSGTYEEYRAHPHFVHEQGHGRAGETSLYPPHPYTGYAWGMVINLNTCIGCNACLVACQSENNIATVGKAQVATGREMHWIRIDHYHRGGVDQPDTVHQPVPCMHCENAPCEVVCPVGATVHSSEGLNEMVYNRCVGTRYCSNNCPYKVRRFNFLQYSDAESPSLALQRNPDVTVRMRGVMEKCTYCVQRINAARVAAKKEDRSIRDGEVRTACQQACPTQAIVFGDINDPNSEVARARAHPLNYGLLEELNTRPRTTYQARLRHPNPELSEEPEHAG
jgi:MoCo/4Fe-4S cofactor protein with predicted Tat translocation signal